MIILVKNGKLKHLLFMRIIFNTTLFEQYTISLTHFVYVRTFGYFLNVLIILNVLIPRLNGNQKKNPMATFLIFINLFPFQRNNIKDMSEF